MPGCSATSTRARSRAFEGFEDFDLIAFDWYDVRSERTAASQMLLYLDREDLFVFCEDEAALGAAQGVFRALEEEGAITNQQALCHFFTQLLRGDMDHLDRLEAEVNDGETDVLSGAHGDYLERIIAWRGSCCGSSGTMSSWTPFLTSCP